MCFLYIVIYKSEILGKTWLLNICVLFFSSVAFLSVHTLLLLNLTLEIVLMCLTYLLACLLSFHLLFYLKA